ncbi:galectin-9-like [Clarias gariepinus]|uniref:galectin-9-like n=1 Tax=Clarias gariepinus TaxID=13013 RepID=UPI00234DF829|nr:galectin-9-like [Clarias gariepinus]
MAYFYQQQPFYNPTIPFTGSIQGGLTDGKSITVSGRVLPGANRFHVNLQCGSRPDAVIALHINPRYDSSTGYIVTNTKLNNTWGTEERIYQSHFPMGNPFNLHILVTTLSYKISVNGIHIMDYKHRIPFTMVDTIVVDGMVEVNNISFQDPVGIVPAQAGFQPQFAYPPQYATPAFPAPTSYSLPYKAVINGGLQPGRNITIQGVVNPQAHRFHINLRHRSGIAFHYNPRFDEHMVVRNTQTLDSWGPEERFGGMPFHMGQNFQIIISCNPHHYNVFVNGQQVHTFNHRFTRLNEINVLEVSGDLTLISVNV